MTFQKIKDSFRSIDRVDLAPWLLGVGIVSLVVTFIAWAIRGAFDPYVYIPLAVGLVGVLSFGLLDPERIQFWLGSRQARYGGNVLIMSVALIGILFVVNYIVYQASTRTMLSIDLTEKKTNSLDPKTIETLQTLKEPVQARAYFTASNTSWDTTVKTLDMMKAESGGKFTYEKIDPDANPLLASKDGVIRDGIVVLAIGQRTQVVNNPVEQDILTAILQLENPGQRKVYFLTGHGEAAIDSTDDTGIQQMSATLQKMSYITATLNLAQNRKVPDDAKVIVIAGLKQPLFDFEITAIKNYLKNGGGLIVLENPYGITKMDPEKDLLAKYLSSDWGVTFQRDIIIDNFSQYALVAFAMSYGNSPITQDIPNAMFSFFPTAQSLSLAPVTGEELTQTALVEVGAGSVAWGESNYEEIENNKLTFEANSDFAAPLTVAASVEMPTEDPNNPTRIVVFGDEDFAENGYVNQFANSDLLINSVDWVTKQENLIDLTPKDQTNRLIISPAQWVTNAIMITSIGLVPGSFVLLGLVAWYNRRKHK